jgi:hypothetical protein
MQSTIDMKQARENQKFWDNWLKQEKSLMVGNAPVDNKEAKEQVAEKLGLHKRSITPTTLDQVVFDKNPYEDLSYKELYQCKNSMVTRFAINTVNIGGILEDLEKSSVPFIDLSKQPEIKSIKTTTYRDIKTKELIDSLIHSGLEKYLVQQAVSYLLSDEDNRVALVDILERSIEVDKVTIENEIAKIHTVVLYKNSSLEGKHEIVVIDPSNFFFSSHLSNQDMFSSIKHENFGKITTKHEQIQLYVAPDKNKIGALPEQWRDCIDIAVKMAVCIDREVYEKSKALEFIDLNKIIKEYDFVQMISNAPNIDKSIKFKDISCRIKQASDPNKIKQYFDIEKVFDKNLQILKEASSKTTDVHLQKLKEPYIKLYDQYNFSYFNILSNPKIDYNEITSQLLKSNHDMGSELLNIHNQEQSFLLGECYEI